MIVDNKKKPMEKTILPINDIRRSESSYKL
jgi:hypothetical protein